MRLDDMLDSTAEDYTRLAITASSRLLAMRDAMGGQPGAQRFDSTPTTGHTTVVDDEGTPMPAISDPTGEAAVRRATGKDRAAADHREVSKLIRDGLRISGRITDIFARYGTRPAGHVELKATEQGNARPDGCEHCATQGRWSPLHVERTTAKGNLPTPMRLCRWCYDWTRTHGVLPTDKELRAHHEGRKLRRPA